MGITDVHGTYAANMTVGYAGMIADSAGPKDVASRTIENAVVAFGLAVGRGTADSSARLGGSGFALLSLLESRTFFTCYF